MVHEAVHAKAVKGLSDTLPSKKATSSAAGPVELKRGQLYNNSIHVYIHVHV